jgi:hypothetical protein
MYNKNYILRFVALMALALYLIWNLYFLLKAQLPPSILYKITGVPSPTTGMYRSFISLIYFDFYGFLQNNPVVIFFLPIVILILINLSVKYYKKEKLILKKQYSTALFLSLFFGEIFAINNYLI